MNFDRVLFNKYKANFQAFEKIDGMKVHNARIDQERATSTADFFKEHGFVLLQNYTDVKVWNADSGSAFSIHGTT